MTVLLILAIAAALGWAYGRWLSKADGETMMALGPLVLAPWAVIAIGTVIALLVLT